jgi:hypothetical protein
MRKLSAVLCLSLFLSSFLEGQSTTLKSNRGKSRTAPPRMASEVCADCIRAHEEFLASDAMQGRGSATHDELVAATYVASQLRQYGIQPAGDDGSYIQRAPLTTPKLISTPKLLIKGSSASEPITWTYGNEFRIMRIAQPRFSGALRKLDADKIVADGKNFKSEPGAVVLLTGSSRGRIRSAGESVAASGAVGILMPANDSLPEAFPGKDKQLPKVSPQLEQGPTRSLGADLSILELNKDALVAMERMADGVQVSFEAPSIDEPGYTWNAIGILRGSDPALQHSAVLLSAHLDHLGIGIPVNGDDIYNGADDDASGTTAVLELARVLGKGLRPRRTVIFALFGSEEVGGLGSTYFREHPPIPLKDIAANLEFEMIGRADIAVKADTVWLTGWERSNLGPTLAKHGANLVGDPHPAQNFFARSDNYVLAKKGVVAQTVSSYGLHADYHQPSDDLAHLDFKHMDAAIGSLLGPVEWLANSNFKPTWNKGGQP